MPDDDLEWTLDRATLERVDDAFKNYWQGDVFPDVPILRYADANLPLTQASYKSVTKGPIAVRSTLPQAAIISQTCEVVRTCARRPLVQVASVVTLQGQTLIEARRGWRPQYVSIPWAGTDSYLDLDHQGSIEKSILLRKSRIASANDALAIHRLGIALGRYYSRFAFPDDLARSLEPLIGRLRDKAGKTGPQGRRIDEVREIRARATPDWDAATIEVELIFLIDNAHLEPGREFNESTALPQQVADMSPHRLAEMLDDSSIDQDLRSLVWQRLVDGWARLARPFGVVASITGMAMPYGEFSRDDAAASPELDLDYLSS